MGWEVWSLGELKFKVGGIIEGDIDRLGILMERIMWEGWGVEVGNDEGMRWEGNCWDLELIVGFGRSGGKDSLMGREW